MDFVNKNNNYKQLDYNKDDRYCKFAVLESFRCFAYKKLYMYGIYPQIERVHFLSHNFFAVSYIIPKNSIDTFKKAMQEAEDDENVSHGCSEYKHFLDDIDWSGLL